MKHPVGITKDGSSVYVDLINSQAAINLSYQPHLLTLVSEAVGKITIKKGQTEVIIELNMGRPTGYDAVVATTDTDTVLYAQVIDDTAYTRFIKNGKPSATAYLTIILRADGQGEYELHDTWTGRIRPPRPGSEKETADSKPYWENHAFVLQSQHLQLRTVTKDCPY